MIHRILPALALSLTCTAAVADITVRFQESAPKDRFIISSECSVADVDLAIDLRGSAGNLIFDVTASGAGVEVFQPVEVQAGLVAMRPVVDGDQVLSLRIDAIPTDADVIISADLDDVLVESALGQIRVSGSELDGATVRISYDGGDETATFTGGTNTVAFPHGCLS